MKFDLAATLRRLKPDKRRTLPARRSEAELPFLAAPIASGPGLLLDTCVYIDLLQRRAPTELKALYTVRQTNHSTVALAELVHLFGALDPAHPGTASVLAPIATLVAAIPEHRLGPPSSRAAAEAGIVAGMVARLRGSVPQNRQAILNDATLFCQARENGWTLVSRNIGDMDLIDRLVPGGQLLLYHRLP